MAYKDGVPRLYNSVIEDVASNVAPIFAEEGVDEEVLHKLVNLWKSKLMASNAVDLSEYMPQPSESEPVNPAEVHPQQQASNQVQADTVQNEVETVPIDVIVPIKPNQSNLTRTLTIHIPASCMNKSVLDNLLSSPIITATIGLPDAIAATMLQQYVQDLLRSHQQQKTVKKRVGIPQVDGSLNTEKKRKNSKTATTDIIIRRTDGASDDELDELDELEDDSSEDGAIAVGDSDQDLGEVQATDEDPLNSGDDISEEGSDEVFETDNVILCQYDKIIHRKNKWKLSLKHGIMNLEGEDLIFSKATGDTVW